MNKVHVQAGGYNAEPQADWNILTMAQPLMSMKPDGKDDPQKPPKASEWTRDVLPAKTETRVGCLPPCTELPRIYSIPGYRRLILERNLLVGWFGERN